MEIQIERVVPGGDGLGRVGGEVCLVPYALPGDRLRLADVVRLGGVLRGRIEDVLDASPGRVATSCPVFGRCGGCTWLHFAYPAQAEAKRAIVADCFRRIAGHEADVAWAEDASLRLGYRTRATFHATAGRYGFYEAKSHRVADIEQCPLCHPKLNKALAQIRAARLEGEFDVSINPDGDDILLWTRDPVPGLRDVFPQSNDSRTRGARHQFLFDGVPIVCGGFSQASLYLNRVLRDRVRAAVGQPISVLDLYCGSGNFSIDLGKSVNVLGLDHHAPSIAAAQALGAGEYAVGDEAGFVRAMARAPWDTIVLDPPRQGAKAIIPALARSGARRIVYVSCDPATLARDAKPLFATGWSLCSLTAVDMFPNTAHVECVAVFDAPRAAD